MNLKQYAKILYFMLWNIVTFLCSYVSPHNIKEKKIASFADSARIDNNLNDSFKVLKEFITKKILKNKNNSAAKTMAAVNPIYKNKNSVSNRIYLNSTAINEAQKNVNSLYIKRLKDAPATQILILKEHFIRLQDKCVFLSPFVSKKSFLFKLSLIFT